MEMQNAVRVKARAELPTFGTWIMMGHLSVAEILAQTGFDWITIDMEHTAIGYEALPVLMAGIQRHGAEPFVRIEENNPTVIKRVLDCGASGIIVPMVLSKAEAERAVDAARYPPQGSRGIALGRACDYGVHFADYFRSSAEKVMVMAQIEHIKAVERIDEILSVKDLDGIFLGPYDMSGSMGIVGQLDHPRMKEARAKVIEAARRARKILGIHVINPDPQEIRARVAEGFGFIACSLDTYFLGLSARACFEGIRELARGK